MVLKLEVTDGIEFAHPYVKDFSAAYVLDDNDPQEVINSYGTLNGEKHLESLKVTESGEENSEVKNIRLTKFYIALELNLSKSSDGARKLDLQYPCTEFYNLCKGSALYDENSNFIQIKNVKLLDLSNDVYVEGEERPKKTSKKRKKNVKEDRQKRVRNEIPAPVSVNGSG